MVWNLFYSSIIYTTPLLLAAIGGYYSEKAGLVNIALEGEMLIGAFTAVAGAWWTGSLVLGLLFAVVCGAIVGFFHGYLTSKLKCNHIISGMGLNLLAIGITGICVEFVFGRSGSTPSVGTLSQGPFGIPWLFLVGIMIVVLTSYWSKFTMGGLKHRAAGESIVVSMTMGIDYNTIRIKGSVITGILCALAGAQQSIGELGSFVEKMTAGRGFIALAALILARWRPLPVILTSFVFGFASALSETVESVFPGLPSDLILLLPFLLTLIILSSFISEIRIPNNLGKIQ
jgi:ABC-type uncharacterized transport system permease subunit